MTRSVHSTRKSFKLLTVLCLALQLQGCTTLNRIANIGDHPPLSRVQDPRQDPDNKPITMPMPAPVQPERQVNSLWQPGARGFFKDQRAKRVGDLLTVIVNYTSSSTVEDKVDSQRTSSNKITVNNIAGREKDLKKVFGKDVDPTKLIDISSKPIHKADSNKIERKLTLNNLSVPCTITQQLPNGNFVIQGRQEVRVDAEVTEIFLTGIIRPEDISSANTISQNQVAELRLSYGGRGILSDKNLPPIGHQIIDALSPF
ncbi:MAG: flagellar basal body L-ring protein FlgH [Holosporales bacterium]